MPTADIVTTDKLKTDDDAKKTSITLTPRLWRALRIKAAMNGTTTRHELEQALTLHLSDFQIPQSPPAT